MVSLSPDSIVPLNAARQYIKQFDKILAWVSYGVKVGFEIGEMPVSYIEPFIPKVYRYPGHPLYYLYDKEEAWKWESSRRMSNYMEDGDILVSLHKDPNVMFIIPESILPDKYQVAIKLQRCGVRNDKMRSYFTEQYGNNTYCLLSDILSCHRGSAKHTAYLLKKLREEQLIDF